MQTPTAQVVIPMLLENATNGVRQIEVRGNTLHECLEDLFRQYPLLRAHLFDADGALRKHVLILFNDQSSRWLKTLNVPVNPGDTITILQAVSGG